MPLNERETKELVNKISTAIAYSLIAGAIFGMGMLLLVQHAQGI